MIINTVKPKEEVFMPFLCENEMLTIKGNDDVNRENMFQPAFTTSKATYPRRSFKRSYTFSEKFRKCACGKPWKYTDDNTSQIKRNAPFHSENKCVLHLRTRSTSLIRKYDINDDIEDMFDRSNFSTESVIKDIIRSEPLIKLAYDKSEERFGCQKCRKLNCLLVKKVSGYYRPDDVAKHCKADDCWIVANGIVYDVTRYLSKHPGGARSILRKAGKDATLDFQYHKTHTRDQVWEKYRIGRLSFCDQGKHEETCTIS